MTAAALACGVVAWAVLFVLPLLAAAAGGMHGQLPPAAVAGGVSWAALGAKSIALAAAVAGASVILGYLPGKLVGTAGAAKPIMLFALLCPLLLPSYVLYYAWSLPLAPTAALGQCLSGRPEAARLVGSLTSGLVLVLWHWPLAALLMAQGWRSLDRSSFEAAVLEAPAFRRFGHVTLPLLGRSMLLGFGVCFALALAEFTTFHLAGIRTLGTELAVLFDLTGSGRGVARHAWPMALAAAAVAVALWRSPLLHAEPHGQPLPLPADRAGARWAQWTVFVGLLALSVAAPVALLAGSLQQAEGSPTAEYCRWGPPLRRFMTLHADGLAWSGLASLVAAAGCLGISAAAIGVQQLARRRAGRACRALSVAMHLSILLAMFCPPVLLAVGLLELMTLLNLPASVRAGWPAVSAGMIVRYCAVGLVLLALASQSRSRQLGEMAAVDGASPLQAWRHVHWPRLWPLLAGCAILLVMLALTEVPATMILLPPGLPNFAQRLVNQMHYARDQQVIASCLVLVGCYAALAGLAGGLWRWFGQAARPAAGLLLGACLLLGGCDESTPPGQAKVLGVFGRTGTGAGEFVYPRAIDRFGDGRLVVADKTGRVQLFSPAGAPIGGFSMPEFEAGKPTGLSVGPDGNIYVADTHYHRVMVFSPAGQLVRSWGRFGREDGCFIYPTDVAFAAGKVLVSEYGGNDRVSVFSADGGFLHSFSRPGSGEGEFSRPAALAVDAARGRLYVADACNHRIAVYDLAQCLASPACRPLHYIGSAGTGAGQLRYPYGLCLLPGWSDQTSAGALAVCEYGNNRIQLFDPEGKSLATFGGPGREPGQLAYPWALVVDESRRAFVVDAGNNRIQIWQF